MKARRRVLLLLTLCGLFSHLDAAGAPGAADVPGLHSYDELGGIAAGPSLPHADAQERRLTWRRKLSGPLESALVPSSPTPLASQLEALPPPRTRDGLIAVYVRVDSASPAELEKLEAMGMRVEVVHHDSRRVQGALRPEVVDRLVKLPFVRSIGC